LACSPFNSKVYCNSDASCGVSRKTSTLRILRMLETAMGPIMASVT
jgi:hypothetical protein